MPDIDPAALSRSDSITTAHPSSLSLKQVNSITAPPSQKASKTVSTAQRIDLEPLYTSLKAAIGDNWGKYKEAISLFVFGMYRQPAYHPHKQFNSDMLTIVPFPRPPQPKRALLTNRLLRDRRSEYRASSQSADSADIRQCLSRSSRAWCRTMGFCKRQAHGALQTHIWRCSGTKNEDRGHAVAGEGKKEVERGT